MSEIKWSRDEALVLAEVEAGLARGRKVYGRLCLDDDTRDFSVETLEEIRDGIVYACPWLVQARRRDERKARAVGPTQEQVAGLADSIDQSMFAIAEDRQIPLREVAIAARYWADRQLGGE